MINFEKAQQLLLQEKFKPTSEVIELSKATGSVLSKNVVTNFDHPFFNQSAVDGYLFHFKDKNARLKVVGEIAAGDFTAYTIKSNEALRIFTGAPVPNNGDTVVMQEFVEVFNENNEHYIQITDEKLKLGGNIRKQGDQLKKGDTTLKRGTVLSPSSIGFLASIGVFKVPVFASPKVQIIVTGNEFLAPDENLSPGKIYESNGIMLQSALANEKIKSNYQISIDKLSVLEQTIAAKIKKNDILIITGGVSVGDYDFTKPALEKNGFEVVFHKVNQKPGKPILFAKRQDGKFAFGLPGNPRSAMMGYYLYVLPFIRYSLSIINPFIKINLPLAHQIKRKNDGKTHFLSAEIISKQVVINPQQASHMMLSMATSKIIAILPPDKTLYSKGEIVECIVI